MPRGMATPALVVPLPPEDTEGGVVILKPMNEPDDGSPSVEVRAATERQINCDLIGHGLEGQGMEVEIEESLTRMPQDGWTT